MPADEFDEDPAQFVVAKQSPDEDLQQCEVLAFNNATDKTLDDKVTRTPRKPKSLSHSYHSIGCAAMPFGVTRSVATSSAHLLGNRIGRVNKTTLNAIVEAGNLFFEQLSGDLELFAKDAGRKTINETDVVAAMKR